MFRDSNVRMGQHSTVADPIDILMRIGLVLLEKQDCAYIHNNTVIRSNDLCYSEYDRHSL